MGMHLCLWANGGDHPEWNYSRQGHDREFSGLADKLKESIYTEGELELWRPVNINELRKLIFDSGWEWKERYFHLCDLLEKDGNCWIYYSY